METSEGTLNMANGVRLQENDVSLTFEYTLEGWNEVLIKIPVGDFKGSHWDNLVKWIFTFVPYQN